MTLTSPLLLPGVDEHGSRYRVRLRFKRIGVYTETGLTADQANARVLELRKLRDAGLEPDAAPDDPTLAEIGEALKLHKATRVSKKTGRKLRPATIAWWDRIVDPWIEDLGATPV